jgi:hypothetical protein
MTSSAHIRQHDARYAAALVVMPTTPQATG